MLNWLTEVDEYLHQLTQTTNSITDTLVGLESATRKAASDDITQQCAKLGGLMEELEGRLTQRESLLIQCPVMKSPSSLQGALQQIEHPKAQDLLSRCRIVGANMQFAHRKAIGLFVGQFHVSNVTEEFLRLLSGVSAKPLTYDKHDDCGGGSLLDRAA